MGKREHPRVSQDLITTQGTVEGEFSVLKSGLRRLSNRSGGDLSWRGPSIDAAHGFDFRVRLTRRLYKCLQVSTGSATHHGVLLIDWPDSEMYTELLEA